MLDKDLCTLRFHGVISRPLGDVGFNHDSATSGEHCHPACGCFRQGWGEKIFSMSRRNGLGWENLCSEVMLALYPVPDVSLHVLSRQAMFEEQWRWCRPKPSSAVRARGFYAAARDFFAGCELLTSCSSHSGIDRFFRMRVGPGRPAGRHGRSLAIGKSAQ